MYTDEVDEFTQANVSVNDSLNGSGPPSIRVVRMPFAWLRSSVRMMRSSVSQNHVN